MKYIELALPKH